MMFESIKIEHVWRYSINDGEYGGIVFASNEEKAREKIIKKYNRYDFLVWSWENDEYYDEKHPDVFEVYGY